MSYGEWEGFQVHSGRVCGCRVVHIMNGIYSLQPYIKYNEVLSFAVIKHSKNNRFLENLESSNVKDMDCCCFSVAELYPTLCDPMDCSRQGFSVFHHLLEFSQNHVH